METMQQSLWLMVGSCNKSVFNTKLWKGVIKVIIKEGRNAVNIVTENYILVQRDMDVEIGQKVILGNGREYEIVGFTDDGLMMVK